MGIDFLPVGAGDQRRRREGERAERSDDRRQRHAGLWMAPAGAGEQREDQRAGGEKAEDRACAARGNGEGGRGRDQAERETRIPFERPADRLRQQREADKGRDDAEHLPEAECLSAAQDDDGGDERHGAEHARPRRALQERFEQEAVDDQERHG